METSKNLFPEISEGNFGLCGSCPAVRTNSREVVKPVNIMMKGVYNRAKKDVDSLRESTRLWNGKDILLYKNSDGINTIYDHPIKNNGGLSTDPDLIVGQIRDPFWDEDRQRIRAVAHFFEDKAPPWLIEAVMNNEPIGVSGAYFCDKIPETGVLDGEEYDVVETRYVPNNLAIVSSPACKLPYCGINTNGEIRMVEETIATSAVVTPSVTSTQYVPGTSTSATPVTVNVSYPNLEEKDMVNEEVAKMTLELDSQKKLVGEKDEIIAAKDAEIVTLNGKLEAANKKLSEIATKFATEKFLSQFPEVNREKAKAELLPMFLENPAELVLNAAKMNELMSIEGNPAGEAREFVPQVEVNSEDKVFADMGVPSVDELKKKFGL